MVYDQSFLDALTKGLRASLPVWGMPPDARLSLLTISENATYKAEDDSGRSMIIRVHRPGYHTDAEILSELAWIEALRRDGVVVTPSPLAKSDGSLLTLFSDGRTMRRAVAFEMMSGREPDASSDLVAWYRRLGEINARLHGHARGWTRPSNFVRKIWNFDTIIGPNAHWGDWRAAPGLDAAGLAILERVHALLERQVHAYGESDDRFGLVHCDMRAANLLVEGNRLGVIDFDDCGISWFGYDFAAAASFMEQEPFIQALMAAWLDGYARVADFSDEHRQMLPIFIMLRRMQLTAWIASHSETPTAQALGPAYTQGTIELSERHLSTYG